MKKLRSLLVGTSGFANRHAEAYGKCDHIELAGVCGHVNQESLNAIADTYHIPVRGTNLKELIRRIQPDIVDAPCNPRFRLGVVEACVGTSVKLVNLEKPMALFPSEVYAMEELCRKHGLLLTVNHQMKYIKAWRRAADTIKGGEIGEVSFIRAACQGNLLEQGTHLMDMTLFFLGFPAVEWVMGQVDELSGLEKPSAAAPDAAIATVRFKNGVTAYMELGSVGHPVPGQDNKWMNLSIEVYGSSGNLVITLNDDMTIRTYRDGGFRRESSRWTDEFMDGLADHLDAAALYAQNTDAGHLSDLQASLASFQAIMAIYASAAGGGKVDLPARFDDGVIDQLKGARGY